MRIGCGVANNEKEEWAFVVGAVEDGVEKFHGAGCMGEGGEAGVVKCGDEEACGNANRFGNIIVLVAISIGCLAKTLGEDGDEPRGGFEEGFVGVGAKWGEVV